MEMASSEQVKEILLQTIGEDSFNPETSSERALFRCLYLDKPVEQLRKTGVSQETRLAIEQHIHGLVFTIGCEAEASETLMLDYVHPLTNSHSVLPRLFDIVLSLGDSNLLEPGFIFTLIERLVEMTMQPEECHKLIDWILANKETLKKEHIFDRGKLILLRTVNRMLKILQRGRDHAYHSGRLLFFMSELYPMAERSATNHSGLRDTSHPVKLHSWNAPLHDDFGRVVDKSVYELYWKTMDHIQKNVSAESEALRSLDMVQRLLDFFKSHPCRRDASPYLSRSPVVLVNDTTPEQFTDIIRDADCRMECIVQIYVFVQKLLSVSKNPIVNSDAGRQRLNSTQSDLECYVRSDHELKQRWGPIHECLSQEMAWIEWKNDGATDWTLSPLDDHPWEEKHRRPLDEQHLSDIHACLDDNGVQPMDFSTTERQSDEIWDMKSSEGIHVNFDRDLELPDFDELSVPVAKEFLGTVFEDSDEMEASMEILEADTAFCWRTYRLLSEHDIQHMVDADHRTNFAKLLKATRTIFNADASAP